ncbi:major facilitator superfamily domain-containing protein [Talaromyces proteolyticus]|uniref:Major facilitator superfamily domain-containing protein n=1 Tax=Talaromyces proteolyticus TaxID=1131652 RepID=A0AAD4PUW9_9EURO|nr:major facilitator superfamily domain-containing protein [Talaromyces proteolyticus]KAH8689921.1 major facilitator superfamily domain-containing protein [Talaromyces proteolyticus]
MDSAIMHASTGEAESNLIMTPAEERKLVRKIDLHLIPLMFILYLFQYLDKTSLGYTAIMGILQDAVSLPATQTITLSQKLVGTQYSWVSSFFYVGFLAASPLSSILLVKFSAAKVVVVTVLIWAGIQMCMAAGNSFGSLAALRILLGAFEAAVSPGFTIITSTWYKPSEHALRHGLWYGGASVATIFGGILAYAVSHIHSAIKTWQFLFIIFGAATFLWGLIVMWLLPDNPQTAWFLSERERKMAFARVQGARHSTETRKWNHGQMREALMDPRSWLLFLLCVFTTLPGGGLTAFGSVVLKSFGYSVLQTQLLTMSQGAFLLLYVVLTVVVSVTFKNARCVSIALLNLISLAGALMIKLLPDAFPTILSLVSSNITGHTKKSTVNGMLFVGFCVGYIVGPLTFLPGEAPAYKTAFNTMIACFVLNVTIIIVMRQLMARWNKKRDQEFGAETSSSGQAVEDIAAQLGLDETDWENKSIRYSL